MNWHDTTTHWTFSTVGFIYSNFYKIINMSLLMYKYRQYPSRKQKERLINSLKVCKTMVEAPPFRVWEDVT